MEIDVSDETLYNTQMLMYFKCIEEILTIHLEYLRKDPEIKNLRPLLAGTQELLIITKQEIEKLKNTNTLNLRTVKVTPNN